MKGNVCPCEGKGKGKPRELLLVKCDALCKEKGHEKVQRPCKNWLIDICKTAKGRDFRTLGVMKADCRLCVCQNVALEHSAKSTATS